MAISYIFSKESFSYIPRNKTFLYFRKQKPRKKFLMFQERELFYISGDKNSQKIFIFQETELSNILGRTSKALKTKIYYISP